MVQGKQKSRSLRRIHVKTPGQKKKILYKPRKPKVAKCGNCKKPLKGIPRLIASKFKKLAKTKKRPQRPFGGVLCSKCSRKEIIKRIKK